MVTQSKQARVTTLCQHVFPDQIFFMNYLHFLGHPNALIIHLIRVIVASLIIRGAFLAANDIISHNGAKAMN
jgi:hypothetical protein